jgi:DNA methylase/ParB/Sulfiredoxin domain
VELQVEEYPITKVAIDKLQFDSTNPNKPTKEQIAAIKKSFQRFGYLVPIVVNESYQIGDGEHRALIYKELGIKEIPAYIVAKINDDIERRLLRQTMNKLHGLHENIMDANELVLIFQNDRLPDLMELIAKNHAELSEQIMKHSTTANKELLDLLLGEDSALRGTGSLATKFGVPPFSILDATSETWQKRKKLWLLWGLNSVAGRENLNYFNTKLLNNKLPSASIFDPVLCEISYRWFTPKSNSKILDPFAGGIVRGLIASFLGHEYHGIDIREEQIDANEKQWLHLNDRMPETSINKPSWYLGDACNIDQVIQERDFDMLLTSPPYFQQEDYSKLDNDLNNLDLNEFFERMSTIINKCSEMLKKSGSFVVWNTSNTRDPNTGKITNIIHHIIDKFESNGFFLLNDLILMRSTGSLSIMAPRHFMNKRFVGSRHENVLVFYRGNDKKDIPKLDINVVEIPEYQEPSYT